MKTKKSISTKNCQSLILDDLVIDILYNKNLKYNPYLVRFTDFDYNLFEFRANNQDLLDLKKFIENILVSNSKNE
jgi:hypothetical protein